MCMVEQVETVRAIVEEAYKAGASRVIPFYIDRHVRRSAIKHAPEEMLGVSPHWQLEMARGWYESRPALISLTSAPEPGLFDGLDTARVARSDTDRFPQDLSPARHRAEDQLDDRRRSDPRLGAARCLASRMSSGSGRRSRPRCGSMRPTRSRPGASRTPSSSARAATLASHAFDAIRYRGPGTDLTVGLHTPSRWVAASGQTETGITHLANIPTEEVFTTPDRRRAEGTVRSTYPLIVPGLAVTVTGLEFTIRDGRIVETRADGDGAAMIEGQLGARRATRPTSVSSRSSPATRRSRRAASSSRTPSSTRMRAVTSPTAAACRSVSKAPLGSMWPGCWSSASTSRRSTPTS